MDDAGRARGTAEAVDVVGVGADAVAESGDAVADRANVIAGGDHRSAARRMAAECLCFRARRVSRLITRVYDEALRPLGIQATQLTLLNAITMCGEAGATRARIADVLAMDQTTLSRNARPLERAGLIRSERLASDRRVRIVRLTRAGARALVAALPLWEVAHERVVSSLGAPAAAELRERFDAAAAATRLRS